MTHSYDAEAKTLHSLPQSGYSEASVLQAYHDMSSASVGCKESSLQGSIGECHRKCNNYDSNKLIS